MLANVVAKAGIGDESRIVRLEAYEAVGEEERQKQ
jgi:hypothetical protein